MRKGYTFLKGLTLLFGLRVLLLASPVTSEPPFPTVNDSIVVYFDATKGNQGLKDFAGPIYAHTGVLTDESATTSQWKFVKTQWGEDTPATKLDYISSNLWKLSIGFPREYYGIPDSVNVTHLAFVFRSSVQPGGSYKEGKDVDNKDIFIPLYEAGITARFVTPSINLTFNDPRREPLFLHENDTVHIMGTSIQLFTKTVRTELWINDDNVLTVSDDTLFYELMCRDFADPMITIRLIAADAHNVSDTTSFIIILNPGQKEESRPDGLRDGISVNRETNTVTFSLFAPYKDFVHLIGDFNDWMVSPEFELFRDEKATDAVWYWITIPLEPEKEYAFQYLIDGKIRIADPYTTKILDPWNDHYIPSSVYPGLKPYPAGKTKEITATLNTFDYQPFPWTDSAFVRPDNDALVIYELLIRDFLEDHSYESLIDTIPYLKKLGINAVEVMPFNEFEGNSSWGYNPIFYFAPDKYYGTNNALKHFINTCHEEGIAVIMDMVLNHSYGQSPLVRMYWNSLQSRPSADNPWFNEVSPNQEFSWGYDFDHESLHTQAFMDSVLSYWLQEYHIDGYRLDFTKGFTNTSGNPGYDTPRINLLKRMADEVWSRDPDAYLILEHWADNSEEKILSDYGMMLWGNVTHDYQEAAMGYTSNFSWGYYKSRGWNKPHLVTYMESHDEERMMYKNITWGKSSGDYSTKDLSTALNRVKLASAFFYTLPGPKMLWQFGELGYDVSIDNPCRICEKPVHWEYYENAQRHNLYKTISALLTLRNSNKLFYSGETTVDMNTDGLVKVIKLSGQDMKAVVVGNFDVVEQNTDVLFPEAGTWYDFFSGDSMSFGNLERVRSFTLSPGRFHIYTNKKQPLPEPGILTDIKPEDLILSIYELYENYPNPFNGITTISFAVPKRDEFIVRIYDLQGRQVKELYRGNLEPGIHQISWDGRNDSGQIAASGIYFYGVDHKSLGSLKGKMVFLK